MEAIKNSKYSSAKDIDKPNTLAEINKMLIENPIYLDAKDEKGSYIYADRNLLEKEFKKKQITSKILRIKVMREAGVVIKAVARNPGGIKTIRAEFRNAHAVIKNRPRS